MSKINRKFYLKLINICLAFILIVSLTGNVYASKMNEDVQKVFEFFDKYGVEKSTQVELIEKFKSTGLIDSIDPTKKPISTETIEIDGSCLTILKFEDGSILEKSISDSNSIDSVQIGDDSIKPFGISGGTWESGSGYRNRTGAIIRSNWGVIDLSFKADYTHVEKGYDIISAVYDEDYYIFGGTISNETLKITNKVETYSKPAEAKYEVSYSTYLGISASKFAIKLHLKDDKAWDTNNMWDK